MSGLDRASISSSLDSSNRSMQSPAFDSRAEPSGPFRDAFAGKPSVKMYPQMGTVPRRARYSTSPCFSEPTFPALSILRTPRRSLTYTGCLAESETARMGL